jgi:hypothetical protein
LNIENRKLQAELAEKESIIEQMVDVSIVTKLNEEIAEKDKEIERLQGTRPFELLAMACQEIIELKEKLNKKTANINRLCVGQVAVPGFYI